MLSVAKKQKTFAGQVLAWFERHGRDLVGDYLERELAEEERIVCRNDHWVALVPWWAVWPFEVMLVTPGLAIHLRECPETRVFENTFESVEEPIRSENIDQ